MRGAYRLPETSPEVIALGRKLVTLLIQEDVSYRVAIDALDAAEDLLTRETKPVNGSLHQTEVRK